MEINGIEISGAELKERCLSKEVDNKAWGYLRQFVYSVVVSITYDKNDPELEDKTQVVLNHIHENIKSGKFNPREDFYSYIYKITRHKIIDWSRSASVRKRRLTDSLDEIQDNNPDNRRKMIQIASNKLNPAQTLEQRMSSEKLKKSIKEAIEKLKNKEHRKVLELYLRYRSCDPEVANYDDIAGILKVKKGTAASLVFRALEALRNDERLKKIMESKLNSK